MAVLGSARAVVAVLVATLIGGVAATALHSIVPDGGPVRGGVAVTVRGVDLENVECYFELRGYEGAPPAARVPCKYDTGADDIGFRCVCEAPPAPQLSKLERVVDPASGSTRFEYVPISGYLSVPVVVWAKGTRDVEFSPFDVFFTYYDLDLAVNVSSIEPTAGHPELETLLTVRGNGFVDHSAGTVTVKVRGKDASVQNLHPQTESHYITHIFVTDQVGTNRRRVRAKRTLTDECR